jgi:hypothetical protein
MRDFNAGCPFRVKEQIYFVIKTEILSAMIVNGYKIILL